MILAKKTFFCVLMMASNAFADTHTNPIDSRYDSCIAKSNNFIEKERVCIKKATTEWDKELNMSYTLVMRQSDKKQKKLLKNAQRAWLKFRDNEMALIRYRDPDTLGTDNNYLEMVRQRTLKIENLIINEQGDGAHDPEVQTINPEDRFDGFTGKTINHQFDPEKSGHKTSNNSRDKKNTIELLDMLGWMEAACGEKVTAKSKHGKMLKAYEAFRANPQSSNYATFVKKIEYISKDNTPDGTGTEEKVIYLKNATYRGQQLTKIVNITEYNTGSETIFFDRSVNWQSVTENFVHTKGDYATKYNNDEHSISCGSFY